MCGIAGSINFQIDESFIRPTMMHRGPDDQRSFYSGNVQLFHWRLSILDLAGGVQPMHYLNRYTIVFNGEIYNHQDARKQLGLQCNTNSDTETILQAYHVEGASMLHRFDGMFALAIYDAEKNEIFMARDRAGKKPLYYFRNKSCLVFASELNALRSLLPLEIDGNNLLAFLRLGSCYSIQTPYAEVKELEQGAWMTVSTGTLSCTCQSWFRIGDYYSKPSLDIRLEEALEILDQKVRVSVKRRLESSDLEVGSFLSGGIDSGIVSAVASQMSNRLRTFTVSFDGAFDEAPLARLVANKYGTDHQEINISFSHLADDVPRILAQYGEPFYDSSAIPSWYVSRAASKHLRVILNGDGADELFGGYRRYVPFRQYDFYAATSPVRALAKSLLAVLPPGHQKKSIYNYLYRLCSLASVGGARLFLSATSDIFEGFEHNLAGEEADYLKHLESLCHQVNYTNLSGLRKMMWLDFDVTLFDDFLVKMDIATMAHSLEGRSPLLGKELLEWVPTLPDKFKIDGKTTKFLLRKLAARYLPAELLNQPKRGFEVPLKDWVNGPLATLINDSLRASGSYYPNVVMPEFVTQLLDRRIRVSDEKRAKMLWTLTSLEVWYRHQKNLYRVPL
jgi:asparagine synthase (glutamine-hydrolysing)